MVSAAMMAVACVAVSSSATAGSLWVGTRNPATGQITVRTAGLKPTFGDGTPVGGFSIREVTDGLFGTTHYLLVRRTATGAAGGCQTEATGVARIADKFFLDLDASVHPVLYCANLFADCTSCRVEQNLDGYYCACINNGNVNGECEGRMNDILKGEFILEWALPNPDPTPSPHGN
jgi:hypothetical protein